MFWLLISILYLFHGAHTYEKFQCLYDDNYNNYVLSNARMSKPVISRQSAAVKNFDDIQQFESVKNTIKEVLRTYSRENIFDNISGFLALHSEYQSSGKKFSQFFDNLKQVYNPSHLTCSTMSVQIWEQVLDRNPNLAPYLALSAGYSHLPQDYLSSNYQNFAYLLGDYELPRDFKPLHVAGFMKISIGGRSGHIIIEPSFFLRSPIVVMKDNGYPHNNVRYTYGKRYEFEYVENNKNFILAHVYEPNGREILSSHLYFVGRSYCSFLQSTDKRDLVKPFKFMSNYKANEQTFYSTTFFLKRYKNNPEFSLKEGTNEDNDTKRKIKFEAVSDLYRDRVHPIFSSICEGLGYDENYVYETLTSVRDIIQHDDGFVKKVIEKDNELKGLTYTFTIQDGGSSSSRGSSGSRGPSSSRSSGKSWKPW